MEGPIVAWVGRPTARKGLDHLGTQQPCILIYSSILPGITNVTDRAHYYGFYPWFIRAFEKRRPEHTDTEFRLALRKADCLLTLIAHRHGLVCDDGFPARHGGGCPGTQKLGPAVTDLKPGDKLSLSRFADRSDENKNRYFKNALGGLGQYYLGVLRDELQLLVGNADASLKYTHELGGVVADDFAGGLDEKLFFSTVEADEVDCATLDQLAGFCPCALASKQRTSARARLLNVLLGREIHKNENALRRRKALHLVLNYLQIEGGAETEDPAKSFLTACYSGSLSSGQAWTLPNSLETVRTSWSLYLRNEMLSLAWSALFKCALDVLGKDSTRRPLFNLRQTVDWLLTQPKFAYRPELDFDNFVARERDRLPPIQNTDNAIHEIRLWWALMRGTDDAVAMAAQLIARLLARHGLASNCYQPVGVSRDELKGYPLTLDTLASLARRWAGASSSEWMHALITEALSAHQRVAIRKLGQSGEDTLMFRTGESGVFVDRELEEIPQTQPRLRQVFQILNDLGLIDTNDSGRLPILTDLGSSTVTSLVA